jgi:hypothetical protein
MLYWCEQELISSEEAELIKEYRLSQQRARAHRSPTHFLAQDQELEGILTNPPSFGSTVRK